MRAPNQLANYRVLVTGASGFLGSHVCRALRESDADVHAVSRTSHPDVTASRWWQSDLTDAVAVRDLLKAVEPELIFHLAGSSNAARDLEFVLPTFRSDLLTTVNLLTVGTELGFRRMVLTGSLEEPRAGDPEISPSSPYAAAKWTSGAYARMFHRLYGAPIVIVRVFMTYGPGDRRPHKLVPYVIHSLLQGESPKLTSAQRQIDWIYIDDVVAGLLAAAHAPDVEGCTIDLGSGVLVPIRTVVQQLVTLVGASVEPLFGAIPERVSEQVCVADTECALTKLGWKPATSLEDGLALTVRWHREQLAGSPSSSTSTPVG